ncbi:MAG: SGNH/GDSL hydrolase family protein [Promethearchaeota archaeon]
MTRFWSENPVTREPCFPISKDGRIDLRFLAKPTKIISLEDSRGNEYSEGEDFDLSLDHDGRGDLKLPRGSPIVAVPEEDLLRPHGTPDSYPATRDGKFSLLWSETGLFHETQLLLTYERVPGSLDGLEGMVRGMQLENEGRLPNFREKIRSGDQVNIVLFGDSISAGHNASGFLGLPPSQPPYGELLVGHLSEQHPARQFRFWNFSEAGRDSRWGRSRFKERLKGAGRPRVDLLVLAWGMNDATGGRTGREFARNLERQLKLAKRSNPECEVVVLTPMLPNPLWNGSRPDLIRSYSMVTREIARCHHPWVLFADLTRVWDWILQRKNFYDLTGNGINHPNDFGHRMYADILDALLSRL